MEVGVSVRVTAVPFDMAWLRATTLGLDSTPLRKCAQLSRSVSGGCLEESHVGPEDGQVDVEVGHVGMVEQCDVGFPGSVREQSGAVYFSACPESQ